MVRVRKSTITPSTPTKGVGGPNFIKNSPKRKDTARASKNCRGKLSHASPPRISTRSYFAKYVQTTHLVENQNPQLDCRVWQTVTIEPVKTTLRPAVPVAVRGSPRHRKRETNCESPEPVAAATLPTPSSKAESRVNVDVESEAESNLKELKSKTAIGDPDSCSDSPHRPDTSRVPSPDTLHLTTDSVLCAVSPEMVPDFIEEILVSDSEDVIELPPPPAKPTATTADNELASPPLRSIKSNECVVSPTPHKIQLCIAVDPPLQSPSTAMAHLHISAKKPGATAGKSRRRLNPSQTSNRQAAPPKRLYTTKKDLVAMTNHKVTEYFPIRRSGRKTKRTVLEEKQLVLEQAVKTECEEGLEVRNFEGKGRGVVATRPFMKGDFVVEYCGELIEMGEAKTREQLYTQDQNTGCYMYYFKYKNNQYCIDATKESGRLGRLVNHSRNGNLTTKTISIGSRPHLVLLAKEAIAEGEEVLYDYGDRSKESLMNHPWLNL